MSGLRTRQIVQKLWNASKSLQGGGVTYYEYVTELTYLLLLKMLSEVTRNGKRLEERLPKDCRWAALRECPANDRLHFYRNLLLRLGDRSEVQFELVNQVFTHARTSLTKPDALASLVSTIDAINWYEAEQDGLGDLYEGLLEKTTVERKSKAGQYFTPRPLIDAIIAVTKPRPGEIVQDPSAGTGGFLIAVHREICRQTNDLESLTPAQSYFQRNKAYTGAELIVGTHRLNTMNLLLHGIEQPIAIADTLTSEGLELGVADLILSNPPFNRFPERVAREDFTITQGVAKGPLPFMEHIIRALKPAGRAAVVVPDSVLFEDGIGRALRTWLLDTCNLHTILRLPTGIFYAQGVKTNVLFFTKSREFAHPATKDVWIYDMRAHMPNFGRTRALLSSDFSDFITSYGEDPEENVTRIDGGEFGRFRKFTRAEIGQRHDNLDISWLKADEDEQEVGLTEPEDVAAAILGHLRAALQEMEAASEDLVTTGEIEA